VSPGGGTIVFTPKIKLSELDEVISFLNRVRSRGVEAINEDAVKLAAAVCLDLRNPKTAMGARMYDAFTPHATNIAAEDIAFRTTSEGKIEVLMEQRPEDDVWFSKQWAGLGVGFRNTDRGRETALQRLIDKEFKVPTKFVFVDDVYPTDPEGDLGRGWYECKLFLAFPEGEPANGTWFLAEPLPPDTDTFKIVDGHRTVIIPTALAGYKKYILQRVQEPGDAINMIKFLKNFPE
jgi:hypothetical protein